MTARPVVLVVEDELLLREMVVMELLDAGFGVLQAADGDTAIETLRSGAEISLLLTDIRLPGAHDGWSVARHARAFRPALPVIYVTGYSPERTDLVPGGQLVRKPYLPTMMIEAAASLGVRVG